MMPCRLFICVFCLALLACCTTPVRKRVEQEPDAEQALHGGAKVMTTPKGRKITVGTVDDLGFQLPLDQPHSRAPRPEGERQTPAEIQVIRDQLGASPFPEVRLGPDDGHTQNETSIDVSGKTLVAGWNEFNDGSLGLGLARSGDGGLTWTQQSFDTTLYSDPVVSAGGGGRWYFAYIAQAGSDLDVFVHRSIDDGVTWEPPVAVTNNTQFDDKPYMDAYGDEVLVAYVNLNQSAMRAAVSANGGQTFGPERTLNTGGPGGNGAAPVIVPGGPYLVFWRDSFQESLWMARSMDKGASWEPARPIVDMDPLPSMLPGGSYRIVNLPSAASDPVTGAVVVVWNDQVFGDPDIVSIQSEDGGDTWSDPVRVNDDVTGQAQFFPWPTFDPAGILHVVWYDRRENGTDLDLYYTRSFDRGQTFEPNIRLTAQSFTPVLPWEGGSAAFIGDYNGIAASARGVYPFYQDAREGNQDVYVARLPSPLLEEYAGWPQTDILGLVRLFLP